MRKLFFTRIAQTVIDLSLLSLAYWLAFFVRFDGPPPFPMFKRLMFTWPYLVCFQFLVLAAFGIPRFAWRYVSLRDAKYILGALSASCVVLLAVRLTAGVFEPRFGYLQYAMVPIGVIGVDLALAFLGVAGIRVVRRSIGERSAAGRRRADQKESIPTLLAGAGEAGVMVAKELESRPDLGISPIGFVDDDTSKVGTVIHGLTVLGTTADIQRLCRQHSVRQVLITIANAPGSDIRRIATSCEQAAIPVKIIPGIYEIVGGQVNLSRIRDIAIEDLLGRAPVQLDSESISGVVENRTVLVTGAGGSIGSELCRQIHRFAPAKLVLVERAENALFDVHRELLERSEPDRVVPVLGDVGDAPRMDAVLQEHRPAVIFHAAAHKHVPMVEWNPGEAVKNNVFGTRTIADLADAHGVRIFVQVSTDKAVRPTSVMGASKRIAEMYLQSLSRSSRTRFVTVRFGNVLGSVGSVVQIFREQIASGGPVTVTHPDMQRYFMMIPEACQLVLQAGALAKGGEVFLLDMGEPVRIVDLARDMIRLSGYEPDRDIHIEFTGIRPGEKLFEELLAESEDVGRNVHSKILVGRIPDVDSERLLGQLDDLSGAIDGPSERIRACMQAIVPEATLHEIDGDDEESSKEVHASEDAIVTNVRPVPQPAS